MAGDETMTSEMVPLFLAGIPLRYQQTGWVQWGRKAMLWLHRGEGGVVTSIKFLDYVRASPRFDPRLFRSHRPNARRWKGQNPRPDLATSHLYRQSERFQKRPPRATETVLQAVWN
jgi:hypothetical protein